VHSLSHYYGLLTALVLMNSVARCCNTTQFFANYGVSAHACVVVCMGVGKIFSRGALVDFSKRFSRGAKVAKFVFYLSKLRKQHFLLKFSNSCLPSDQARNQLGTPGEAKSFLKGAQIF